MEPLTGRRELVRERRGRSRLDRAMALGDWVGHPRKVVVASSLVERATSVIRVHGGAGYRDDAAHETPEAQKLLTIRDLMGDDVHEHVDTGPKCFPNAPFV